MQLSEGSVLEGISSGINCVVIRARRASVISALRDGRTLRRRGGGGAGKPAARNDGCASFPLAALRGERSGRDISRSSVFPRIDTERRIASQSGTSVPRCEIAPSAPSFVLPSPSRRRAIVRPSRTERGRCRSARARARGPQGNGRRDSNLNGESRVRAMLGPFPDCRP